MHVRLSCFVRLSVLAALPFAVLATACGSGTAQVSTATTPTSDPNAQPTYTPPAAQGTGLATSYAGNATLPSTPGSGSAQPTPGYAAAGSTNLSVGSSSNGSVIPVSQPVRTVVDASARGGGIWRPYGTVEIRKSPLKSAGRSLVGLAIGLAVAVLAAIAWRALRKRMPSSIVGGSDKQAADSRSPTERVRHEWLACLDLLSARGVSITTSSPREELLDAVKATLATVPAPFAHAVELWRHVLYAGRGLPANAPSEMRELRRATI